MDDLWIKLEGLYNAIFTELGSWAPRILGAIAAFIIGLWVVGILMKMLNRVFTKSNMDATLRPFLTTLISFALKAVLFIAVAGIVGVQVASFVALLGIVGGAIALGLQGTLGHLASGVMLLLFKPFKVGDLIEVDGELGFVREISVFVTILETFQNKTSIVPNGTITSSKIVNYSTIGNLRVDMPFGIQYGADIKKAKAIVMEVMQSDSHVLSDPAPRVAVNNLGANGVELLALPYATCDNYWEVYWDTRQQIVEALGEAGYDAPLPQRIVTMKS